MIYLSSPPAQSEIPSLQAAGFGLMLTPTHGGRRKVLAGGMTWAADNGCYSQGDKFVLSEYLEWLELMRPVQSTCLFATAPDVVGDAKATWVRSRDILPVIRSMGYKAALVAQDGLQDEALEWDAFDALFVGGTTAWKLSEPAYELANEARQHGKWVHMGRVNSRRRLMAAAVSGYHSADGTHIAFGPDKRLPELLRWLTELETQRYFVA